MVLPVGDGERLCLGVQVKIDVGENALQKFHDLFLLGFFELNLAYLLDPACQHVYNSPWKKKCISFRASISR